MTDEELLDLSRRGFIPGPQESEEQFIARIRATKESFFELGESAIPKAHWDFSCIQLEELFDFTPESLPAFYSDRALMPWQGAASWIKHGKLFAIQLREALRKGSFLKIYLRGEILSHEAIHAARVAFSDDRWEEFFAYMSSQNKWRRVLGPIVQRPWEVWPFLVFCVTGAVFPFWFLGAAFWAGLGFLRLAKNHYVLRKASDHLLTLTGDVKKARALLFRLTSIEIAKLAQGKGLSSIEQKTLRGRVLQNYLK